MENSRTFKCLLVAAFCMAGAQASAQVGSQEITLAGSQASTAGPTEFFTGRVRVDPVWPATASINTSGAWVTFEPGARSAWHTHPAGQRLVVQSGVGLVQEWGKSVQVIRPGDVVWCPPGVKHWHGVAATTAMTHLAVTGTLDGKNVNWMEKVSDDPYNSR
ncbi:Cupin domain-containing protein [Burkholderiales bacterium 8X]|nr:Cupin domain-containing protein [Burkholderiales bacterium 8X]